jgi:hypothetical protein
MLLAACTDRPGTGSPEYKTGALGNGGFLFQCDDSVACDRWSTNSAKDFPSQIATGSTFKLRFVANQNQGEAIGDDVYPGMTMRALAPYVSGGPDGFTMLKPGLGTVMVRDSGGFVIDYVTLPIEKADAIVAYDAAYKGEQPTPVTTLTMKGSEQKSFRTVAMKQLQPLAGAISVEWSSSNEAVVRITSYSAGVALIQSMGPGSATLTAAGAALSTTIPVQVSP